MSLIVSSVGTGRPNRAGDVRTVQALLNRTRQNGAPALKEDGLFGPLTKAAITRYQQQSVRLSQPDSVVDPGGPTLRLLSRQATRPSVLMAKPAPTALRRAAGAAGAASAAEGSSNSSASPAAPVALPRKDGSGPGGLSEQQFVQTAAALECEVAAVKAVVATEALRGAFDKQGRPTILFERHKFFHHTKGRFAKTDPDICNAVRGGYGAFSAQYPKLERAIKLDREAALKSASWGAFQILGENHRQAGHATVEAFVNAMKSGNAAQADAFLKFVRNDPRLLAALRKRNWATFARIYNGPAFKENNYDGKMRANYQRYANGA